MEGGGFARFLYSLNMKIKNSFLPLTLFTCLLAIGASDAAQAAASKRSTKLAVSQGISSPAITTPVNFSHGFLYTNPAVAADFQRPYISAEATTGNGSSDYGAELGIGNGSAGLAAGYLKNDNSDSGRFGAIAGLGSAGISAGLGFHENATYSLGMIFQPKGTHRIGLAADFRSNGGHTSIGAGYSYHANSVIFALDASRRSTNGNSDIMITPGLEVMADIFALSLSYDLYMNDGNRRYNDQIWFGLGVGGEQVHFAVYHDYQNDWSGALTFWM